MVNQQEDLDEDYFSKPPEMCRCNHEKISHYIKHEEGDRFCAHFSCKCKNYKKGKTPDGNKEGPKA